MSEREQFEAALAANPDVRFWNTTDAMFWAWQAARAKSAQAEAVPQCVTGLGRALTRYDWRRSNIWRYYYASATGTYVKVEDFVASLNQIVDEIDAQKGAQ